MCQIIIGKLELQVYRKSACACVFDIKTRITTTLNDFTMCIQVQASVVNNFAYHTFTCV